MLTNRLMRAVSVRFARLRYGAAVQLAHWTHDPDDFEGTELLWSKGIARLCDVSGSADYWREDTESVQPASRIADLYSGCGGLVWVRLGTRSRDGQPVDLDAFAQKALPTIRRPFVLLTTDGDAAVPSEIHPATVERLLTSPYLERWYTQNCDVSDVPKIRPFPIGLSLHNRRPFGSPKKTADELRQRSIAARPASERPMTVYSDIGVSLASDDRRAAVQVVKDLSHVHSQTRRISQSATWRRYARSRFVLSLKGNGIDAHRTWEALYLGAIVITLRSTLDPLYAGLPVVLLDDLHEIADPHNLVKWSNELLHLTDRNLVWQRLDPQRWVEILKAHLPG